MFDDATSLCSNYATCAIVHMGVHDTSSDVPMVIVYQNCNTKICSRNQGAVCTSVCVYKHNTAVQAVQAVLQLSVVNVFQVLPVVHP